MRALRHALDGLGRAVSALGLWLAVASLAGILGIVVLAVVGRSTGWWTVIGADEIAGYLMVAVVFLGFAHTYRAGGFIRVDALLKRASGVRLRLLELVLHSVALAFVTLLLVQVFGFVAESYRFEVTSIGLVRIPMYIPQATLVVGAAALALQTFVAFADRLLAPLDETARPGPGAIEI